MMSANRRDFLWGLSSGLAGAVLGHLVDAPAPLQAAIVPGEADDGGDREAMVRAVQHAVPVGDALRLGGKQQNGGPTHRYDAQRLVGSVQH